VFLFFHASPKIYTDYSSLFEKNTVVDHLIVNNYKGEI